MATTVDADVAVRFLEALGRRDFAALGALFHDDGRLRGLVPSALREATGPAEIAERYALWFGDLQEFEVLDAETEPLADRTRVRYRFACVDGDEGPQVVEQDGYAEIVDGKIAALNVVCTGFRPRG